MANECPVGEVPPQAVWSVVEVAHSTLRCLNRIHAFALSGTKVRCHPPRVGALGAAPGLEAGCRLLQLGTSNADGAVEVADVVSVGVVMSHELRAIANTAIDHIAWVGGVSRFWWCKQRERLHDECQRGKYQPQATRCFFFAQTLRIEAQLADDRRAER